METEQQVRNYLKCAENDSNMDSLLVSINNPNDNIFGRIKNIQRQGIEKVVVHFKWNITWHKPRFMKILESLSELKPDLVVLQIEVRTKTLSSLKKCFSKVPNFKYTLEICFKNEKDKLSHAKVEDDLISAVQALYERTYNVARIVLHLESMHIPKWQRLKDKIEEIQSSRVAFF